MPCQAAHQHSYPDQRTSTSQKYLGCVHASIHHLPTDMAATQFLHKPNTSMFACASKRWHAVTHAFAVTHMRTLP